MGDISEQRIKLAKAMGKMPVNTKTGEPIPYDIIPEALEMVLHLIPNPFTDANDDYAVLEWMLTQSFWFSDRLTYYMSQEVGNYAIGNFARAALKMIDND